MSVLTIKPNKGSVSKKKVIGRGTGNGRGRTCGRGNKGQKARTGAVIPAYFEGGQMPLYRRVPKKGFKNNNKIFFNIINVSSLEDFADGAVVNAEKLREMGLIKSNSLPVKLLANGDLTKKNLKVEVNAASKAAQDKITAAGGTVSLIK